MAKKRGNPNWGKPDMQAAPIIWSFHPAIVTVIGIASITAVLAIFVIMLLHDENRRAAGGN
jgi:hypothetical protein